MNDADIEKIKERIAKLLRMAQDSSSPHEAAIAAGRARSLMDKYQLSETDLSGNITEEFGESAALAKGRRTTYKNIPYYMNILSVAVATFNDCQAVRRTAHPDPNVTYHDPATKFKGRRVTIIIRGFKSDVDLAIAMFQSLISMIDKACKAHMVSKGMTGRYDREVGEAFKSACASQLVARLKEITKQRDEAAVAAAGEWEPGTALMVIKKREKVSEEFGDVGYRNVAYSGQMRTNATREARDAGDREGRKMEIQPHLNRGPSGHLE